MSTAPAPKPFGFQNQGQDIQGNQWQSGQGNQWQGGQGNQWQGGQSGQGNQWQSGRGDQSTQGNQWQGGQGGQSGQGNQWQSGQGNQWQSGQGNQWQGGQSVPLGNPTALNPNTGYTNTWFDFTQTDPSSVYQQPRNEQDYLKFLQKFTTNCSINATQMTGSEFSGRVQQGSNIEQGRQNETSNQGIYKTGQNDTQQQGSQLQGQSNTQDFSLPMRQQDRSQQQDSNAGQVQQIQPNQMLNIGQGSQDQSLTQGWNQTQQNDRQNQSQDTSRTTEEKTDKSNISDNLSNISNLQSEMQNLPMSECKNLFKICKGFVPNMKVDGKLFASQALVQDAQEELRFWINRNGTGAQPSLVQLANVACLPGIVDVIGLPNFQAGFGFPQGCVAAFDMNDPNAIVTPSGVGTDVNNGVRLLRTNLLFDDLQNTNKLRQLIDELYGRIPLGVGPNGCIYASRSDIKRALDEGMSWALERGYAWEDDVKKCEYYGRGNSDLVTFTALIRAKNELGSLGSGGHYLEIQAVQEIYDNEIANRLGINKLHQICVMIKSGSRGFGHQVAKDYVRLMSNKSDNTAFQYSLDPQIVGAKIQSQLGQDYLGAMRSAANFALVNRSGLSHVTRQSFETVFGKSPKDLDMYTVLDVSYTSIKEEEYQGKKLLIHRNGACCVFPKNHVGIPEEYCDIGTPSLIDGGMGTCSYIVVGMPSNFEKSYSSTCSGASRAVTRSRARLTVSFEDIQSELAKNGIAALIGNRRIAVEEAPENFKDVNEIAQASEDAGLSKKIVKLAPIGIIRC